MSPTPKEGSVSVPGALGLLFVAGFVAFLVGTAAATVQAVAAGVPFARALEAVTRDPLLLAFVQLGGLVAATGVGVLAAFGSDVGYRAALGVRPVPTAITVLAITAGFSLQFPLSELTNLLADVAPSLAMDETHQAAVRDMIRIDSLRDAIVTPLAVVAVPAISEELLFRGLLLPGLSKRYGALSGLLISAFLFGLIHGVPVAIVYATIAGLALGYVRQRTGSVLPCIAMHGAFNAVPVLLPASVIRIEGFNTVREGTPHLPLALALGSALVAAVCIVLIGRLAPEEDDDG